MGILELLEKLDAFWKLFPLLTFIFLWHKIDTTPYFVGMLVCAVFYAAYEVKHKQVVAYLQSKTQITSKILLDIFYDKSFAALSIIAMFLSLLSFYELWNFINDQYGAALFIYGIIGISKIIFNISSNLLMKDTLKKSATLGLSLGRGIGEKYLSKKRKWFIRIIIIIIIIMFAFIYVLR